MIKIFSLALLVTIILTGCKSQTIDNDEVVIYFIRYGKTMLNTTDRVQ